LIPYQKFYNITKTVLNQLKHFKRLIIKEENNALLKVDFSDRVKKLSKLLISCNKLLNLTDSLQNVSKPSSNQVKEIYKIMEDETIEEIVNDIALHSSPSFILDYLTRKELLLDILEEINKIMIVSVSIRTDDKDSTKISNQTHFDQYFNTKSFLLGNKKCYKMTTKNTIRVDFNYLKMLGNTDDGKNFLIALILLYKTPTWFTIIPPGYPANQNLDLNDIEKEMANEFTYDVFESKLLSYPYKTNCFNYSSTTITQDGCKHDCIKHELYRIQGIYLPKTMIYATDLKGNQSLLDKEIIKQVSTKCNKKCIQKDCFFGFYY